MKHLALLPLLLAASPAPQTSEPAKPAPAPSEIVAAATAEEWVAIAASDLLVMELAPDAKDKARRVVIQLMPPPFSQGWVGNIRKLAAAKWWDGTSVNRVQDNYVVQWGDASEKKALPPGLETIGERGYFVSEEEVYEAQIARDLASYDSEDDIPQLSNPNELPTQDTSSSKSAKQEPIRAIEAVLDAAAAVAKEESNREPLDVKSTKSNQFPEGWHQRDSWSQWVEIYEGWPLANESREKKGGRPKEFEMSNFWPVHCYGMVGVGRGMSPDTGSGAELYTVIGHAPRHLDRNIALVGRVIEGIEHLSSLPRGTGPLGFYESETERVPILSVRIGSEVAGLPSYQYLSTESDSFARYADARANRRDPFFIRPAGGADICNIPVPVRRVPPK